MYNLINVNRFMKLIYRLIFTTCTCSMCSLVVSVLDSPAADARSNPGSGSALLMSEKS